MSKLIVFMIAVIYYANANPAANDNNNNIFNGFGKDFPFTNFPQIKFPQIKFPPMPQIKFPPMPPMPPIPKIELPTIKPLTAEDIENLSGEPGSKISGVIETFNSHTEYVDGKPVTKTEGVIIVNKDGEITKTKFSN